MGDIASGVYLKITDNSFSSAGRSSVRIIVPMYLKKGEVGLNEVNGSNFKDIVGYNPADSKYLGLEDILRNVASCIVWRINSQPSSGATNRITYGEAHLTSVTSTSAWATGTVSSLDALADISNVKIAVAAKYPGSWTSEEHLKFKIERANSSQTSDITELIMVTTDNDVVTRTPFSLNPNSDSHWSKVDFKNVVVYVDSTITGLSYDSTYKLFDTETTISGGADGYPESTLLANPSYLSLSPLDDCGCNILLTNGNFPAPFVTHILTGSAKNKIHMFADVPDDQTYSAIATYAESITKNITTMRYLTIVGRPEKVGNVLVHASCKYAEIFANMLSATNSLNYPPAGATYGTVSVQELMPCDYELHKDDMKTNRINYLTVNSLGTMMWEQRTMYADNTDLSYIAPNFIIDELSDLIIEHERRFNFRYMTDTDLSVNKSGLVQILNSYVDRGFLYSYSLKVPNVQEAQASGRTLNIMIKVQVMKDSEVINIDLQLTNNVNA